MAKFIQDLFIQLEIVCKGAPEHFKQVPISALFFIYLILVFILNIIKRVLILIEKKRGTPHQSCEYLVKIKNGQDCNHPSYRKHFKNNGNSCERCHGKSFKMTDSEAENRVVKGNIFKCVLICLANYSKNMLPYISFFYTLVIAIFENNK